MPTDEQVSEERTDAIRLRLKQARSHLVWVAKMIGNNEELESFRGEADMLAKLAILAVVRIEHHCVAGKYGIQLENLDAERVFDAHGLLYRPVVGDFGGPISAAVRHPASV